MNTHQRYLNRMSTDIQMRGLSEHTRRMYIRYTKIFLVYCGKDAGTLEESDAREFLIHLMRENKVTPGTINMYNSAIRFFFAVTLNRTLNYLQLPRFKKAKTLPEIPTREEVQNLIQNCRYFHVVFTIPAELRPVFLQNQDKTYGILFKAVSETLLELCSDKKYLGAKPGITAVLHTWGQNLSYHPHLHCIVTGGGLTKLDTWQDSRKKFFLPVKVLSKKFRGKLLAFLKQAGLTFDSILYEKEWVVYCKPPFKNASKVIGYLGRYTHRAAISNHRLIALKDGRVTFRRRDYSNGNKQKIMTLDALKFIRRFMLHILPSGFRKIRHYGLFASRDRSAKISLCRKLTQTKFKLTAPETTLDKLRKIFGEDFNRCPCCGIGHLARGSPDKTKTA